MEQDGADDRQRFEPEDVDGGEFVAGGLPTEARHVADI